MTLVVDASVAVKWYLDEDGSDVALAIARGPEPLVAPDLVVAEVANVAWRKHRLGQLSRAQLVAMQDHLPGAFEELVPTRTLLRAAMALSLAHDHPAYDCFYLALAEAADATFVTADVRMVQRFAGRPVAARLMPLSSYPVAR